MLHRPFNYLIRCGTNSYLRSRHFHHEFTQPEPPKGQQEEEKERKTEPILSLDKQQQISPGTLQQKYKLFRDEESIEIIDVEEERQRYRNQIEEEGAEGYQDPMQDSYYGLNTKRGLSGVFDIEDLVDVLRKENAEDIFVCSVPRDLKYVDYMVVCSGRSYRHMLATAEFVRRMFKIKRHNGEILPKIEGEKSRDWMAMDLGNIALHIFSPKAREEYDLESLWALGPEYDFETNKPKDPLVELFERHTFMANQIPEKNS